MITESWLRLGFTARVARDDERDQDDAAVDGLLPLRGDLREVEQARYRGQQQHAGEGADERALAAVERDAADHRGREDLKDQARALARPECADIAGVEEAPDRGERTGHDEHA